MSGLLVFTVSHNSILEQNVLARFFFFFCSHNMKLFSLHVHSGPWVVEIQE